VRDQVLAEVSANPEKYLGMYGGGAKGDLSAVALDGPEVELESANSSHAEGFYPAA